MTVDHIIPTIYNCFQNKQDCSISNNEEETSIVEDIIEYSDAGDIHIDPCVKTMNGVEAVVISIRIFMNSNNKHGGVYTVVTNNEYLVVNVV